MKKLCAVIFVLLGFFLIMGACDRDKDSPEYRIVEKDEMVDVMVDVHLVEAALRNKKLSGDSLKKLTNNYYQNLFDKHNISRRDFDSSFAYYEDNVGELNKIYEKVIEGLNKKQRKLEQIKKEQVANDESEKQGKGKNK